MFKFLTTLMLLSLHVSSPAGHWIPAWPAGPATLCANQFALVNRACLLIPGKPIGQPGQPGPGLPGPSFPIGGEAVSSTTPAHHHHRRRHHHHHGHGHDNDRMRHEIYEETPAEEECCRWLREVDSMCACDLLVHLPPFLIKPVHSYTVMVDESCSVTFRCEPKL